MEVEGWSGWEMDLGFGYLLCRRRFVGKIEDLDIPSAGLSVMFGNGYPSA